MTWKTGDRYLSFKVTQVIDLEELKAKLIELEHEKCGAKVLHLACDDPENLFCLSFQTLPNSSNGVAHILEHTVLCGSRKYPVKDPFFAMTRRSLNTFMNALTGADFTCYPAASQVEKDFYNLLDVYLDAVFHPQLKKESFLQEGHRLELEDPKDLKSPLLWKGIVFNEMKGALASPDARIWHKVSEALMPDLTYANISGGDPAYIPSLTYEELIHFHETYYHPSRCLFFFYGNFPLKKHLEVLEENILKNTQKASPLPPLPKQHRFKAPKNVEGFYPVASKEESQAMIAWSWLTVSAQEQDTLLALSLLDAILMETDGSLLKLPLLQSGLCSTADAFLDPEMSEVPYLIICKGCDPNQVNALEDLLLKSLREIADKGIPPHMIEASLHQLELSRTEIGSDHGPFGLSLFMRAALTLQHGGRPEKALKIHTLFAQLREKLQNPDYLPGLIREMLLKNPHRVRAVMNPDTKLLDKEQEEENQKLKILEEDLPLDEKKKIVKTMAHLEEFQKMQEHQNLDCLPKVTLSDVPVLSRDYPLKQKDKVFFHDTFTNGFVYADLVMDLPFVSVEELPYVQLFISLLSEVGVGKRTYVQNLEVLQAHVGAMTASLALFPLMEDSTRMKPALLLRSKALERNSSMMFKLLKEWALNVRFDETERIEELIEQINTALEQRLTKNGLRYAATQVLSGLTPVGFISEKWQGISYFQWIKSIAQDLPRKLPKIIDKFHEFKNRLLSFKNPEIILSCSQEAYKNLPFEDLLDLPSRPFKAWEVPSHIPPTASQGRPIASPVSFTAQGLKVATYLNPHAPGLAIASQLMDHLVLHPKIREQGGAYGAGTTYVPTLGHFTFHTFRDPHLGSSLQTFKEAVDTIANGHFSKEDLESAKLESIQSLDSPISPGNRGSASYSLLREGRSLEHRQHYRDRLLSLTPQEVALAALHELKPRLESSQVVSLGSQEFLEKENKALQKPLPIIPI
ncbi:MAG: insulinase family protein [Rhabdochlamydiaceae bacterium]|nr:insulinase family protein [Rhabdochlamydiaceae bacterium]